jgi:mannitol-specific phosphotransferase system IIBC component
VLAACLWTGFAALFLESRWSFWALLAMAPGALLAQLVAPPRTLLFQLVLAAGNVAALAPLVWSALVLRDRRQRRQLDRKSTGARLG